jgi:6-pyruvoyltetrahydropterin/6-carboxytetrahydropterin synthase
VDWHTVISITKEFRFDAAHYLPTAPKGHPNSRMHGHSFVVAVTLEGVPGAQSGLIRDFADIDAAVAVVRERLDHHVLNEVEGLSLPTLERLSAWIFSALSPKLPELVSVTVRRDSLGESCTFRRS